MAKQKTTVVENMSKPPLKNNAGVKFYGDPNGHEAVELSAQKLIDEERARIAQERDEVERESPRLMRDQAAYEQRMRADNMAAGLKIDSTLFNAATSTNSTAWSMAQKPSVHAHVNMDGGMERAPNCTGFWIMVDVDYPNPISTRLVQVIQRKDGFWFRYLDEVDTKYVPVDAARRGIDVLYVFLWEPEEL